MVKWVPVLVIFFGTHFHGSEAWIGLRTVLNCMMYNKGLSAQSSGSSSLREMFLDNAWLHQAQESELEKENNATRIDKLCFEYHFKNINYEQGIRQIHSPEHIEAVQKHHLLSVFRILNTTEPVQQKNFVSVAMQCKIMGVEELVHVAMYTSKRDECHYRIYYGVNKRANIHFYVKPTHDFSVGWPKSVSLSRGHTLKMDIHLDKSDVAWYSLLPNFLKTACMLEDNILWAYDFPRTKHHEKLAKYRRFVLFYYKKTPSLEKNLNVLEKNQL